MILLVGATGRIGRGVAAGLLAREVPVRVLARDPARARALLGPEVEIVAGDLDDDTSLAAAMTGAGKLYLASAVSPAQVGQQARAIEHAEAAGVRHVVRISSEAVEAEPMIELGRWHHGTELAMERSGMAWTHVRPCNFMHNMLSFAGTVAARGEIRASLSGRMTLVDVNDIAAVCVAALTTPGHEGQAYRVTGDEWLSYHDIGAMIGAALGRLVRYVELPEAEARTEMLAGGMPAWLVKDLLHMYRQLGADRVAPVTDIVRRVTGRAPRRFAAFVQAHAEAFRVGDTRH